MENDSRDRSPNRDDRGRERERSRRGDRPSRFSGGGGGSVGGGGGFRDRSPGRNDRRRGPSDRRVYVSNIAYEFRWQELKDLFRQEVGEVSFVELFVDEDDKPRGCGIVEFESKELAQKAVQKMHRYDLKGRKLVVKEDFDVERDKQGRPLGRNMGARDHDGGNRRDNLPSRIMRESDRVGSGAGGNKWGNTYGLSPQFLESLFITSPLVTRVFVANLDYKVDDKKLREVFKLAGKVITAEISLDKEGKSRGFGVVEYEHPVESVQAISMFHNQMLFDRRLSVRMDRVDKLDGPQKLPEGLKGIGMGLGASGTPLHDVSRNLPSIAQNIQPAVNLANQAPSLTSAALGPSAAAAALAARDMLPNLGGAGAAGLGLGAADLSGFNAAALGGLAGSHPFMAQLGAAAGGNLLGAGGLANNLGGSALGNPGLGAGSLGAGGNTGFTGRDFDSLSAALSGGGTGGFNSNNMERDFRGPPPSQANNGRDPISDSIIIKNLPPTATWQLLKDKFREFGDVKYAELRGKDMGVIQFGSKWDAERAINMMDRVRWDSRVLDVRFF